MATRVIENRRDRLTTILIAPLMSCRARLPVYTVLIAAFIPVRQYAGGLISLRALVMMAMYLVGMLAAVVVALILKRTLLRGPTPPFVLELPTYKWPSLRHRAASHVRTRLGLHPPGWHVDRRRFDCGVGGAVLPAAS